MERKKIKVLVVDDSMMVRQLFSQRLSEDPDIEVVGKAADVYEARDMIIKYKPDVVTLDVEMPKMNGIEFLKKLMPQYPLPVIVVSAVNASVFDALHAGAVEFIAKPSSGTNLDVFFKELITKVKIASTAKVGHYKKCIGQNCMDQIDAVKYANKVIAIGASTGGTTALHEILRAFPKNMPGIVIVQHMPPVFTKLYADRINETCLIQVKEAEDGDEVLPGRALIAPGGYHMRIKKSGSKIIAVTEKGTENNKVSGHCPSVDVLFQSVAETMKANAIGVILTGMGRDGAAGLLQMKKNGAKTIGQDEQSCIVYGMPKVAYEMGAVDIQLPLMNIAGGIINLLK